PQIIGTTSPPESLTVTNCGTTPAELVWYGNGIGGSPQSLEYSQTNNCTSDVGKLTATAQESLAILDAGASCTFEVVFSPWGPGPRGAYIAFNLDQIGGPTLVDFVDTGPECSSSASPEYCFPGGVVAVSVAIAPDPTRTFGRFAYATNANSNTVSMF